MGTTPEQIEADLHDLQRQEDAIRARKRALQAVYATVAPAGEGVTHATRTLIAESLNTEIGDAEWAKIRQSIRCLAQGKRYFHSGEKRRPILDDEGGRTGKEEFVRHTIHVAAARAKDAAKINGFDYAAGELVWAEDASADPVAAAQCAQLAGKRSVTQVVGDLLKCCREHKLSPVAAGQKLAALDESVFETLQAKEQES